MHSHPSFILRIKLGFITELDVKLRPLVLIPIERKRNHTTILKSQTPRRLLQTTLSTSIQLRPSLGDIVLIVGYAEGYF
jgi:hypothetical protein